MYDFVAHLTQYRQQLLDNPHIRLLWDEFELDARRLAVAETTLGYMQKEFGPGFPIAAADQQLLGLPRTVDIAWESLLIAPFDPPLPEYRPGVAGFLNGYVEINSLGAVLSSPGFRRHLAVESFIDALPQLRHAVLFDGASAANISNANVYLRYRQHPKQFQGLVLVEGQKLWPLSLNIGDYIRTALAWYGVRGWQFLYVPLEDFQHIGGANLAAVDQFSTALPQLFPAADWSILASKQAYFDIARQWR